LGKNPTNGLAYLWARVYSLRRSSLSGPTMGTKCGDRDERQRESVEFFLSDEQSVFLCYAVEEKDKSRESHQGSTGAFVSGARKFSMRLKLFLFFLWKPCDRIKS
jgi:hypothetical protein